MAFNYMCETSKQSQSQHTSFEGLGDLITFYQCRRHDQLTALEPLHHQGWNEIRGTTQLEILSQHC